MIKTPSVDKAIRYIESLLREQNLGPGARLPGIRSLSLAGGVSLVTMWKAVRSLAAQGVLEAKHRAGIHVPLKRGQGTGAYLVHMLSQEMLRDIIEGRFHNDSILPSVKELASIYNRGPRLISGAIEALVHDGHLAKRGRGFCIQRPRISRAGGLSVAFIYGPAFASECEVGNGRTVTEQFLSTLDEQCLLRNVRLERIAVTGVSNAAFKSSPDTIGHVIWITQSLLPILKPLLEHCMHQRKPTIAYCLQEEGNIPQFEGISRGPLRILHNDNLAAGRAVGTALLHLGHRQICYILEKPWPWAKQRYEGLASVFEKAGYADAVRLVSGGANVRVPRDMPAAWNLADKSQRITQSILTRIRKSGLDEKYALQVTKRLADAVYGPMLYCVLEESMRTALARGDATAWVAADDYIALYAVLPFLQSRRIRVPRDLSVAGFNNQFESGYTGLSSYHFDIAGMAMRMLTFLLHPALDRRLRPGKYAPLHEGISGFIVERGSMGSLTTAQ